MWLVTCQLWWLGFNVVIAFLRLKDDFDGQSIFLFPLLVVAAAAPTAEERLKCPLPSPVLRSTQLNLTLFIFFFLFCNSRCVPAFVR